jgi:hypothetical protein
LLAVISYGVTPYQDRGFIGPRPVLYIASALFD